LRWKSGKLTVEETLSAKLSVHDVMRGFDGANGFSKLFEWLEEDVCATITVRTFGPHSPSVCVSVRGETGLEPFDQELSAIWTCCPYGGRRWWWLCPKERRQVTKLYLPYGTTRFLSRAAYGLEYQSQRDTDVNRARRQMDRLEEMLLFVDNGSANGVLARPKGMHRRTFDDVLGRLAEAQARVARATRPP
jgi:hypothetical protein